jgi:hypothetical protein
MGDTDGCHQANLFEAIASRVAELQTPHQGSAPAPAPAPAASDASILPTGIQQMQRTQQMMVAMQANSAPNAPTDRNRGRPTPTGPRTGTPGRPLPAWATHIGTPEGPTNIFHV